MALYSIKDLERISNQKAHTIRIWEQRYGLLEPERTDTNIRFYDDQQLKKLLNVCTLMSKGMKISHISKLSRPEMVVEIDKIIAESFQSEKHVEAIINQALISLSTYDQILFDELFSNAIKRFGMTKTYSKIIYPLLVRTGLMWIKDDLLPAQEHFLSNLIKQKLFSAIDALPLPKDPDQSWILFLNESEDHEIGLLFANYLIRQHGKKVIYLGQRVPYNDLTNVVEQCNPTHIYSFFVRNQYENEMAELVTKLSGDFGSSMICISGGDQNIQKIAEDNNVMQIKTIDNLIEILTTPNA
ncbi:MerR family transcriptional regulator [Dyadobacter frigoris]|uniref:MerR family transcriptional regulator n=1 Tax=Dyadobacter frigoris TaxID=2576211 RepID=A0A4U6CXU6_9BACT|nr:MerR family transcriptional regulator [Dyadobacter frigoris]TKT88665.1 MerR family transcriptional regulator [Dyadobacter frigoris]GLU53847.1 MerR family transcriptional regulator [Dyadobacter frigoris]